MQGIGNRLYLPWCLEGLAGVAAVRDAWEIAARLCGTRDAVQADLGLGLPPADPATWPRTLSRVRGALGEGGLPPRTLPARRCRRRRSSHGRGDLVPGSTPEQTDDPGDHRPETGLLV